MNYNSFKNKWFFLQYIHLLLFCCFKHAININCLGFCVYVFFPFSEGKKILILQLGNVMSWYLLPFATIFFSGQNDLIQQLSKKHFTVAIGTGRSSIKMPCENEDLPEEENAPDFDEDTLRGELGSTLASAIVRTINIPSVSRMQADVENDMYSNLVRNILQLLLVQEEVQLKCHVKMKTYLRKKMHQILMRTLYEVS